MNESRTPRVRLFQFTIKNSRLICLRQLFLLRASAKFEPARLGLRLGVGSQLFPLSQPLLIIGGWGARPKGDPPMMTHRETAWTQPPNLVIFEKIAPIC